jgi:RNA recognition motif-containing protein
MTGLDNDFTRSDQTMGKRLYVGNLNYRTTDDALRDVFAEHGTVVEATVIEGKGFGFVEMDSDEAAAKAREAVNGLELDERELRVEEARPRSDRGGGGSGRDRW